MSLTDGNSAWAVAMEVDYWKFLIAWLVGLEDHRASVISSVHGRGRPFGEVCTWALALDAGY